MFSLLIPKTVNHRPVDRPLTGRPCVELLFRFLTLVPFGPLLLVSVSKIHFSFLSTLLSVHAKLCRVQSLGLSPPFLHKWATAASYLRFICFASNGALLWIRVEASLLECKWVKPLSFLSVGFPAMYAACILAIQAFWGINEASAHLVFFVLIWNWRVQQQLSEVGFVFPQYGVVSRWQRSFYHLS